MQDWPFFVKKVEIRCEREVERIGEGQRDAGEDEQLEIDVLEGSVCLTSIGTHSLSHKVTSQDVAGMTPILNPRKPQDNKDSPATAFWVCLTFSLLPAPKDSDLVLPDSLAPDFSSGVQTPQQWVANTQMGGQWVRNTQTF